jgi:LPS export ABC transporter protein LptC
MAVPLLWNNGLKGSSRSSFFISIAIWLLLAVLFSSCEASDKELKDMSSHNLGVEEIKNADINYTLGGKAKAKLLSPLMLRVQENIPYVEFPKKLHVDFYNDSGRVDSRLDALYGKYFETQSKVFLKDSIVIINVLGDTLYCNELWWDRNKAGSEFYTDKPVRIRRKMEIIDGVGMEARQDFKEWHIIQSTGVIKVPNSQFPTN